jgi:hypothetical protein
MRSIKNAFDAYWFLHDHPKFRLRERDQVTKRSADRLEKRGFLVTRDKDGKCWREWRHLFRYALDENLDIHYAKTNSRGVVVKDASKNTVVRCWLEFGQLLYEYPSEWHTSTQRLNYHDINLDCGGDTFDEALIKLAKLVLKHYGDYASEPIMEGECGQPVCADCKATERTWKRLESSKRNRQALPT